MISKIFQPTNNATPVNDISIPPIFLSPFKYIRDISDLSIMSRQVVMQYNRIKEMVNSDNQNKW
ncbi:hypothetical protein D3C73_1668510 [compost metagenome]